MNRGRIVTVFLFGLYALAGCAPPDHRSGNGAGELRATEVFDWSGQPISFALPPAGWERQRSQPGGREGVRFIHVGSVGEEVRVEERFSVANRDRCARLQELLRDLENMDDRTFATAIQQARLHANPPINDQEVWLADEANASLDEARTAFRADDPVAARWAVAQALEQAGRIRYALDEVVDQALYKAEGFPPYVRAEVGDPAPAELAGEPALRLDYTLRYSGREYEGREIYVLKNNHLFVVGYQGLAGNLPMFEQILDSVSFPDGRCRH